MCRKLSCHETFHGHVSQREEANPLRLGSWDVLPGGEVNPSPPSFSVSLSLLVLIIPSISRVFRISKWKHSGWCIMKNADNSVGPLSQKVIIVMAPSLGQGGNIVMGHA